jgi:hypothetical protein
VIQLKSSSLSSLLDRTVSFVPIFFFFFMLCTFCVSKLFFYSNKLLSIKKKRSVRYCWKRSLQSFGVNSIGKEPSIKSPKLALESRTFGAVGIN